MPFNSIEEVQCHVLWKPFDKGRSRERVRASLEKRTDSEPGLRILHRVSLAYISFLDDDEKECSRHLESSKEPRILELNELPPVKGDFLIKAMELHFVHKFNQSKHDEQDEQEKLGKLSVLWQDASVQAECWGAKGWTLLSFGRHGNSKAMKAFRKALELESTQTDAAAESRRFHWTYGLALAMARERRKRDLSADIGDEKFELWQEARSILQRQGIRHPVFLARFAEAVSYSVRHMALCEELADEAIQLANQQEKYFKVYITCPKVYRALKKLLSWTEKADDDNTRTESLRKKELDTLQKGKAICATSGNTFFKSDLSFQYALYYLKNKEAGDYRYDNARQWLRQVNPSNIWASLRLLALEETELANESEGVSQSPKKEVMLKRYETLYARAEENIGPDAKKQVQFQLGRFLFVQMQNPEGIEHMKQALDDRQFNERSISKFIRRQIMDNLKKAKSPETDWFATRLEGNKNGRFPMEMYTEDYRWRLACNLCANPCDVLRSRFRLANLSAGVHECAESILLGKKGDSDVWSNIRSYRKKTLQIDMCPKYQADDSENECRRSECEHAHNNEEVKLWTLQQQENFDMNKFLQHVRMSKTPHPLLRRLQDGRIVFRETGESPRMPQRLPKVRASLCVHHFSDRLIRISRSCPTNSCDPTPQGCNSAHSLFEEQLWNKMLKKYRENAGLNLTDETWQSLLNGLTPN